MCKRVEKRDGRIVEFDHSRIFMALQAAFKAANLSCNYAFVCRTATKISEDTRDLLTVEDIQDLIVNELKEQFPDVAIVYKEYRHKRDMARRSKVNKTLRDIVNAKLTDITTENGNMNADTPSGMMYKFALSATATVLSMPNALNFLLTISATSLFQSTSLRDLSGEHLPGVFLGSPSL